MPAPDEADPCRVALTREELLDLITTGAVIGWDRRSTGEPYTRGDLTHQIEIAMGPQLRALFAGR